MMAALSMRALAQALNVEYAGPELSVAGVCTDSRKARVGDIYIALQGERFDGHVFIEAARGQGAVAAVVAKPIAQSLPQLVVTDTRAALGLIARVNRRSFNGQLVGITGSAGKTTCKEMLAAILAECGPTLATSGNLNNEIGVPLTLLRLAPGHRFAVIEMGAARTGDIAYLCQFAEPDIGVVTSALPAHLEGFGSVDNIAATKGEIFAGVRPGGTAVIHADDRYTPLWLRLAAGRTVLTFGLGEQAQVRARNVVQNDSGIHFELVTPLGNTAAALNLLGLHNLRNALAASAAAIAAGAPLTAIAAGLANVRPVAGRLQPRRGSAGNTVIDDSYNANPGAVMAAIDVLAQFAGTRQLILGNMAELGATAQSLHCEVAHYAATRAIEQLWCVGPFAQAMVESYKSAGGSDAAAFADKTTLIAALAEITTPAVVLVKGSRSAGMEVVVAALCGDQTPSEEH